MMSDAIEVRDDGTAVIRDGCGSEILLRDGNIELKHEERLMAPVSLKAQVLSILTAVSAIAGVPVKALLSLAIWAIGKYLPDDTEGDPMLVGAAPDGVKNSVRALFDRAAEMIPNAFYRRAVQSAANLVLDRFVDAAWDALAKVVTVSAMPPVEETEADKAASAALEDIAS